jgi:hypothetical protein
LPVPHLLKATPDARVLVVSQRLRAPHVSRATIYELEDVIAEVDAADVAACPPRGGSGLGRRLEKAIFKLGGGLSSRRQPPRAGGPYELAFVACEDVSDLVALGDLRPWLVGARIRVCWIEEMWARDVNRGRFEVAMLRAFDHVFLSCAGTIPSLREATSLPVTFLAPAVDAITFHPGGEPRREIDVYNMGRRSGVTHGALLRLAAQRGWFYVYDTIAGNRVSAPNEHRFLLANLIKRTRYFVANRAKIDHAQARGQDELGARHFEGAAGGAVLIGEPPQCDTFRENFDWPDAVVPMPWDAHDPAEVIDSLEADPVRVARIRADNVRNVLLRHDWVYRWQAVLRAVGLAERPELTARTGRLAGLAGGGRAR